MPRGKFIVVNDQERLQSLPHVRLAAHGLGHPLQREPRGSTNLWPLLAQVPTQDGYVNVYMPRVLSSIPRLG